MAHSCPPQTYYADAEIYRQGNVSAAKLRYGNAISKKPAGAELDIEPRPNAYHPIMELKPKLFCRRSCCRPTAFPFHM
jgi:hypothetical protein